MARLLPRRKQRPLRCSRAEPHGSSGGPRDPPLCRICWEGDEADGNGLVAPCACSGSMRHVHVRCLGHWQQQLRVQKGIGASRRCDVCRAPWSKAFMPPATPRDWREALRGFMGRVPWGAVLECWRFGILLAGAMHGMQAGVAGFRSGMRWAAGSSRANIEGLARWAPEVALAAGTLPPLKVPMALCLGACVVGLAAQAALMSMVCAYTGTVVGFARGVTQSLLITVQLGSCLVQRGTIVASTLAGGAFRGTAAAGRLAAPLVLGLVRTLALTRLFN